METKHLILFLASWTCGRHSGSMNLLIGLPFIPKKGEQ